MENKHQDDMFSITYCTSSVVKGTLFYFHGGGFVASSAYDLPQYQLKELKERYDIVLVDYPLAPEVPLQSILQQTYRSIQKLLNQEINKDLHIESIVFYGRSAGAYMAMYLTSKLVEDKQRIPDQLILLYGYTHFNDEAFLKSSPYYQDKSSLTTQQEKDILSLKKTTTSRFQRTLVYMNARKTGKWLDYLSIKKDELDDYNLLNYLNYFPKTFIGYAFNDPDVDFEHSKVMERLIPDTHVFTSHSDNHMFDQDLNSETKQLMIQLIDFLK
jgi:acetyl esterase